MEGWKGYPVDGNDDFFYGRNVETLSLKIQQGFERDKIVL
jgi:hypothetical protein